MKTLWKNSAQSLEIHFSADLCPSERDIASKLTEYYNEIKTSEDSFPIVFFNQMMKTKQPLIDIVQHFRGLQFPSIQKLY